jgi:hypothetical protein
MNSFINEMPGPLVGVNERAPLQEAPMTAPMAESSSSAWMMAKLRLPVCGSTRHFWQKLLNASISEVEGVIGYHAPTVAPAYMQPNPAAVLPSMRI